MSMELSKPREANPAPGFISQKLMLWAWPLVWLGRHRALEREDVPGLSAHKRAKPMCDRVLALWDAELARKRPSLPRAMWRLNKVEIICGATSSVIHGLLTAGARPVLLRHVIRNVGNLAINDVILLAVVLILEALFQAWNKQFLNENISTGIGAGVTALISKTIPKTAGSTQSGSKEAKPSEVNLIGTDLVKTLENSIMFIQTFTCVVQLITSVIFLLLTVGAPSLFGLAWCVITMCMAGRLAKRNKVVDKKILAQTDTRIGLLKQILDGLRFIKVSGWEDFYMSKSTSIRATETYFLGRYRTYEMLGATIGRVSVPVACLVTFCGMAFLGQQMKAEDIFAALSVFMSLRLPLGILPAIGTQFFTVMNSFNRIGEVLRQPAVAQQSDPENPYHAACLHQVELQWSPAGPPVLQGVSLDIKWGQSVGIIGTVASGKTTLLMSIIGGLTPTKGIASRSAQGVVSYVPQRALIFSGSVLSNVIMGHPRDDKRLDAVLASAQFTRDLELMPAGLDTEIGERGTTLSGGQQMRLNVARALYHNPQMLVADDPLAAVDIHVAALMFEALQTWLKGDQAVESSTVCDMDDAAAQGAMATLNGEPRTLVMSLNQLHLLPEFDQVVYLNGGSVSFQGSNDELDVAKKNQAELSALIESANVAATCDSVAPPESPERASMVLPASPKLPEKSRFSTTTQQSDGKLVKAEHRVRGRMANSVFFEYIKAVGAPLVTAYLTCLCVAYGFFAVNDWYLAWWVREQENNGDDESTRFTGAAFYAGLTMSHAIGMVAANFVSGCAGAHASRSLHKMSLGRVLRAPVSWFEETPSGRTLSKFSADINGVDLRLPTMLDHCCQLCFVLLVLCGTITAVVPWFAIFLAIVIPCYAFLDGTINKSSREIKRMSNMALSPVLTLIQEASTSRALLRVMKQEDWLHTQTMEHMDVYNMLWWNSTSIITFLRLVGALLGSFVAIFVTFAFWAMPSLAESGPGGSQTTGLAVAYSFTIPYFLSFVTLFISQVRIFLSCLERLLEFQSDRMPQEKPWRCQGDPGQSWPEKGAIEFRGSTLRYRPELPAAVHDLTLTIQGGERLGVVGRTGAGKSSLSVLLLRIVEPDGGSVLIDGIDICQIGLHALRRAVAVVPQEPFLFQGPLRQNLDPLDMYQASDLSEALSRVCLPMALDAEVGQGGGQLSAGERQLIAIARATLSTARIIIMDEPTANCDAQTDDRLQQVTREAFKSRTLLCIAHRLNTILEYDRVLVMEAGCVAEVDSPDNLLKKPGGHFAQMVAKMQKTSDD